MKFAAGFASIVATLSMTNLCLATDYSVCIAQFRDMCGNVDSFISCPTRRLTNDAIARSICTITNPDGSKTVGRYRVVALSDIQGGCCGISNILVSCLDQHGYRMIRSIPHYRPMRC